MSVGAAEAERVDPDHHWALGKGLAGGLHLHRAAVEVDLRIGDQEVLGSRGERAVLHHQNDFEQRAVERGGFHVADIALDARNAQRNLARTAAERRRDRVSLDPVADDGAGRMSLDIVEFSRVAARPGAGLLHEFHLRVTGGRGDVAALGEAGAVIGGAGCIHRGCLHDGADAVAVPFGPFQWLDRKRERAFGAHVAVGLGVEGMALAVRADHPQGIE